MWKCVGDKRKRRRLTMSTKRKLDKLDYIYLSIRRFSFSSSLLLSVITAKTSQTKLVYFSVHGDRERHTHRRKATENLCVNSSIDTIRNDISSTLIVSRSSQFHLSRIVDRCSSSCHILLVFRRQC
jgi:hypothetical protein